MSELEVSQSRIAVLLLVSFASGLTAASLHRIECIILAVAVYQPKLGFPRFSRVAEMLEFFEYKRRYVRTWLSVGLLLADISLPVISAIMLISVNFIVNNGQMRLYSVFVFIAALWLWRRILYYPVSYVSVYTFLSLRLALYYISLPLNATLQFMNTIIIKVILSTKTNIQHLIVFKFTTAMRRSSLQYASHGMIDCNIE